MDSQTGTVDTTKRELGALFTICDNLTAALQEIDHSAARIVYVEEARRLLSMVDYLRIQQESGLFGG